MRDDFGDSITSALGDISIHVPRMRDDTAPQFSVYVNGVISIHVPRMRDDAGPCPVHFRRRISIHVPRMRDDFQISDRYTTQMIFQSTSLA